MNLKLEDHRTNGSIAEKNVGNQAKSSTFSVWTSEIGLFIDVYKGNIKLAFGQYLALGSTYQASNPTVVASC